MLVQVPIAPAEDNASSDSYIEKLDKFKLHENYRPLLLDRVISQGLKDNFDQQKKEIENKILDLNWKDTYESFWYPDLKLTLTTTVQSIELLRGQNDRSSNSIAPYGTFGLTTTEYTLFNWGKDYLAYLNDKADYEKNKRINGDNRRELRHQLLSGFYQLSYLKHAVTIAKTQLRHASFIYRLNKEKATLKKISAQEYYQSRTVYLQAQEQFQQAQLESEVADEQMAKLISDPSGSRYTLRQKIKYAPAQITLNDAITIAQGANPDILNAQTSLNNARRDYEVVQKENLPLPKITMDLGAYTHQFGKDTSSTQYYNSYGNKDLEVVARINATWTIWGENGFFNSRKNEKSLFQKYIAEKELERSKQNASAQTMEYFTKISHYENVYKVLTSRKSTLQKNFDSALENYMRKKTTFLDLKIALEDLTQTDIALEQAKYLHVQNQIFLASTLGIDDFPGTNFEEFVAEVEND